MRFSKPQGFKLKTRLALFAVFTLFYANSCIAYGLTDAIDNVKSNCMPVINTVEKLLAPINVSMVTSGLSTVGAFLGTGVGIEKVNTQQTKYNVMQKNEDDVKQQLDADINMLQTTQMVGLAVAGVGNAGSAALAVNGKLSNSIKQEATDCVRAIKDLSSERSRAKLEQTADASTLNSAKKIIDACSDFEYVNWHQIDNLATASAVASGVGAGTAVGAIVSAIKSNNAEEPSKKADKTTNILSGTSALAGGTAMVLNMKRSYNVKKIVSVAKECKTAIQESEN